MASIITTWPEVAFSIVFHVLSALHSASALSKAGFGNLGIRMYVFFAIFPSAPESFIGCKYVPIGCAGAFRNGRRRQGVVG